MLDEGSIAYFQKDEAYYCRRFMLNDDFICQTGLRDGETGFWDLRMTPSGRQYRRMQGLQMHNADPKEGRRRIVPYLSPFDHNEAHCFEIYRSYEC
jgi:hypothetical protein